MIGQTLSHYEITGKLGAGGMGEVYLGRCERTGETVGLKYINTSEYLDKLNVEGLISFLVRFLEEYDLSRRVPHPNIPRVIGTNIRDAIPKIDGLKNVFRKSATQHLRQTTRDSFVPRSLVGKDIFIVSEFVAKEFGSTEPAPPISECFQSSVSPAVIKMFFVPVLDALAKLHDENVAHRDLKPDNLLVSVQQDGSPVVKIIDFGIAKDTNINRQTQVTRSGSILGTPEYLPPIPYTADDKLRDIYAMGQIFYELLTNTRPFEGMETVAQILHAKSNLSPFAFSRIADRKARSVVRKMLSPRPENNFQTMSEVIDAWRQV